MEKESIINLGEEKSVFERAIIEAFKQNSSKLIFEKLNIALDEIKYIIADIKKNNQSFPSQTNQNTSYLNLETGLSINSNNDDIIIEDLNIESKAPIGIPNLNDSQDRDGSKIISLKKKFLLNKNILDKLSRITERKFFNVNILIAKIFDNLLESENFYILSDDYNLLINFSNEILNLLDIIKSTLVAPRLNLRCYNFLEFLIKSQKLTFDQAESIKEIIANFPFRNSSETFKNFSDTREKILRLVKVENLENKLEGLNMLMESYGSTYGLTEQLDLLYEHVFVIIKALIQHPNPEYRDAYYQLGSFICSLLFSVKFKIDAFTPEYRVDKSSVKLYHYFLMNDDILLDESNKDSLSFLHNSIYELTTQKDLLAKCENIFKVCNMVISLLAINENMFDLQFICYIILRRIYFIFPQFRENIEDNLAMVVVNLALFKDQANYEVETAEETKLFILYIMKFGEESLINKIKKRLESRGTSISVSDDIDIEEIKNIEFDSLRLADFNLRVGFPSNIEIDAGNEEAIYIEVNNANSVVYVGFATTFNDISFHMLKYIASDDESNKSTNSTKEKINEMEFDENVTDKGHFRSVLKIDRIDSSINPIKLIFFVKEPGTYKIIWDNSFSWFTGKTLKYRLSVLKPLSQIDIERRVDFEQLRADMQKDQRKKESGDININLNEENNEKHYDVNENKLMMLKFEGKNRSYKISNLIAKEDSLSKIDKYLSIPILIIGDIIKIYKIFDPDVGLNENDIIEINKKDFEEGIKFDEFFETQIKDFISNIPHFEDKTILLNLLVLEKPEIGNQESLPVSNDEFYKQTINKLGFFPEILLSHFKNLRLFVSNLADACLINQIYDKIVLNEQFNNIIHIHFDRRKTQLSMYMEGVINDRISGLNFELEKGLIDNLDNVIEFLNKIINIFGSLDVSVSFSGFDDKIVELFLNNLKSLIHEDSKEDNGGIQIFEVDKERFIRSIRNISLFHLID